MFVEAVDRLHDAATIDGELYLRLAPELSAVELLDLFMVCGWYHAISFTANAAGVALEDGAPHFGDVRPAAA